MVDDVLIEATATPPQVAAVNDVFARRGFDIEARPVWERRSADVLPWIVQLTLAVPIMAFLQSLGSEAGKDAYAFVKEVFAARSDSGNGRGAIELSDSEETQLILSSEITDEALAALARIDWEQARGGYMLWNEADHQWRNELP
jgi:hypothetical protein